MNIKVAYEYIGYRYSLPFDGDDTCIVAFDRQGSLTARFDCEKHNH